MLRVVQLGLQGSQIHVSPSFQVVVHHVLKVARELSQRAHRAAVVVFGDDLEAHLVADLLIVVANLALGVADGQGCPVHRQCGFSGKLVDA